MNKIRDAFLITKYGEERFNLLGSWLTLPTEELEKVDQCFTFDYPDAFTDYDFLCDLQVWEKMKNKEE